jgi:hypothetical protein
MLLFAQALGEYSGVSSHAPLTGSLNRLGSNLWDGLRAIDQQTWWIIGGALLVLMFVTRRSKRY